MKGNILGRIVKKVVSVSSKKSEVSGEQKMRAREIAYSEDLPRVIKDYDFILIERGCPLSLAGIACVVFCSDKELQEVLKNADGVEEYEYYGHKGFKISGRVDKTIQKLQKIFGKEIELD
ncbi:MAG: hypothetical protein WC650_04740 [Candidatus Doudnabacteria bacterium]